jgi:hypothetical protein
VVPEVLEQERRDCIRMTSPDQYGHIWEGDYASVSAGAYYAQSLARCQGPHLRVAADPLMTLRAFWDIGGTGAKADACAIWIAQFVGREIRVLDYYEAQGQPLATHVNGCASAATRRRCASCRMTARRNDKVYDVSYESALKARASRSRRSEPGQGRREGASSGAGCSRRSGSTKRRRSRAREALAGITKSATRPATSALAPNTIGPRTARTPSG